MLGETGWFIPSVDQYGATGTITSTLASPWSRSAGYTHFQSDGTAKYLTSTVNTIGGLNKITLHMVVHRSSAATNTALGFGITNTTALNMIWSSAESIVYFGPGVTSRCGTVNTGIQTTGIVHITLVYNGATAMRVFVNGIEQTTTLTSVPSSTYTAGAATFRVGAQFNNGSYSTGLLEASAYQRILSNDEIRKLSMRPGIAYEANHRRSYKAAAVTGNRRRRLLVGS